MSYVNRRKVIEGMTDEHRLQLLLDIAFYRPEAVDAITGWSLRFPTPLVDTPQRQTLVRCSYCDHVRKEHLIANRTAHPCTECGSNNLTALVDDERKFVGPSARREGDN